MYGISLLSCGLTAICLRKVADKLPLSPGRIPVSAGVVFLFVYLPLLPWQPKYLMLGLSVVAFWMVGLIDDLRELPAWARLRIEGLLAVILIISGWQLHWFSSPWIDLPVTFLWIVGITNAFNLIDNTDGLCAGITFTAAVFLATITGSVAAYALVGICLAFWIFNFPPAMMWMGDCGSLFLGVNMACLSMDSKIGMWAILILIVPIADTIFVVARRISESRSPFQGGKDHLSHELGKWALPVLYLAGFLGGGLATWLIL